MDAAWSARVEAMLDADGVVALAIRDELAHADRDRLATSVALTVADASRDETTRFKAAWLLKDTCNLVAVPYLERTLLAPSSPHGLREQILDTLERFAFGGSLRLTNLRAIDATLVSAREHELFSSLLITLADDEALSLLREKVNDRKVRPAILSLLASLPEPWVDTFLESLTADDDPSNAVRSTIEQRALLRRR